MSLRSSKNTFPHHQHHHHQQQQLGPLLDLTAIAAGKNRRRLSSFKSCDERGTDNATNYRQGRLVLFIAVLTHESGGPSLYFFVFAAPEERPCTEKGKRGSGKKKKSALRLR